MTLEEVEKIAKQKADAIIAKEKNLVSWYTRASAEVKQRSYAYQKESEKIAILEKEASDIKEGFESGLYQKDLQKAESARARLEYIVDKMTKHEKSGNILAEKQSIVNNVAEVLIDRMEAQYKSLNSEKERLMAEVSRLENNSSNNLSEE